MNRVVKYCGIAVALSSWFMDDALGSVAAGVLKDVPAIQNSAVFKGICDAYGEESLDVALEYFVTHYPKAAVRKVMKDFVKEEDAQAVRQLSRFAELSRQGLVSEEYARLISALVDCGTDARREHYNDISAPCIHLASAVMSDLEKAHAEGGRTWLIVKDDPVSLQVYHALCVSPDTRDDELWAYYCGMDSRKELAAALSLLPAFEVNALRDNGGFATLDQNGKIHRFLQLCETYPSMHEYVRRLMRIWGDIPSGDGADDASDALALHIPLVFTVFDTYGDVIEELAKVGIPVEQRVDVVLANQWMLDDDKDGFMRCVADAWLCYGKVGTVDNDRNSFWYIACSTPEVFSLYNAMFYRNRPLLARVLEKRPNLSSLLGMVCKDKEGNINAQLLHTLLDGIESYDEVAISAILESFKYPDFANIVVRDKRTLVYIALKGSEGVGNLSGPDWRGYLDKEIDEWGNIKSGWMVDDIPLVGGVGRLAVNFYYGYPTTWGEVGAAVVDVVGIYFDISSANSVGEAIRNLAESAAEDLTETIIVKELSDGPKITLRDIRKELGEQVIKPLPVVGGSYIVPQWVAFLHSHHDYEVGTATCKIRISRGFAGKGKYSFSSVRRTPAVAGGLLSVCAHAEEILSVQPFESDITDTLAEVWGSPKTVSLPEPAPAGSESPMDEFRRRCEGIKCEDECVETELGRIRALAQGLLDRKGKVREVQSLLDEVERRVDDRLNKRIKDAKAELGYPTTEKKAKALFDLLALRGRLFAQVYKAPDLHVLALPEIDAILSFADRQDYAGFYRKRAGLVRAYSDKRKSLGLGDVPAMERAADTADMLATPTVYTFNVTSDGRLVDGPHRVNVTINGWGDWAYGKTPNVHQIVDFTLDRTARWHINDGGAAVTFGTERWPWRYHERVMVYENSLEQPLLLSLLRRHGRTVKIKGDTFSWTTEGVTSYEIRTASGREITAPLLQETVDYVATDKYWKELRQSILTAEERH